MHKSKNILLLLLMGLVMMACQEVVRPDGVLSAGDFEDVLYDMHLSHYLDYEKPSDDTLSMAAHRYALTLGVLKKHDVTQAEWDSSLVYYTRHSPELKQIYGKVYERMATVAENLGASVGDGAADSSDIWRMDRHMLLTSQRGYTTKQWTIKTDTLLQAGEKLTLQCIMQFLNTQVQNRMMAVISIRLNNDSVICRNQICTQTGIYTLNIEDDKKLGIKSVSGYFMMMRPQSAMFGNVEDARQTNSNQIVSIIDIRLTHKAPPPPPSETNVAPGDSVQQKSEHPDDQAADSSPDNPAPAERNALKEGLKPVPESRAL